MIDIEELEKLHEATSTPELSQLCWYDVKGEQDAFFTQCLEDLPELLRELRELREIAAMRAEHGGPMCVDAKLYDESVGGERDDALAECERWKEQYDIFRTLAEDGAVQLRELREAAEGALRAVVAWNADDFNARPGEHTIRDLPALRAAIAKAGGS